MSTRDTAVPAYADLVGGLTCPPGAAWGVFGNDLGTLNFATAERVVAAATLVRRGVTIPLNWSTTLPSPPILGRRAPTHHRVELDGGGFDDYYDSFYPQMSSQWDALSHVEHPEFGFYQGRPLADVLDPVFPALGIDQWATRGIAGRFVLADVEGFLAGQGTPLDAASAFAITTDLLDDVLAAQDVALDTGDILLLNVGWICWYEGLDESGRAALGTGDLFAAPGLDPREETARWIWDHRLAAVAADCPALERMPFDKSSADGFLHARLIPLLGLAVGELFDLRALTADCRTDGVYEGLFCAAPLNTPGGAGSTANALAIK
ncbi:cyclase family protein [Phytohabitans kaempferiae]|uniref:Cyclase family protein n=1 Tax=Phytohabitans kaempferiae TaxID=1620943 RepID=A0ABV6MA95_9ACTN